MIIAFESRKNVYRVSKYVAVDFDKKIYTTQTYVGMVAGYEIKIKDYNDLIEMLKDNKFKEVTPTEMRNGLTI